MKGPWKVTSNLINGKTMYAVYRLKDVNEVDHSGNREFAGGYVEDRLTVEIAAEHLNEKERPRQSGAR